MHKRTLTLLLVVLTLLLGACSPAQSSSTAPMSEPDFGESGGGYDDFDAAPAPAMEMEESAVRDSAGNATGDGQSGAPADGERIVIKTADLSIAVEDPTVDLDEVMKMAEEMGGFVVSSNLYYYTLESGVEVPQADVTIRVPSARFDEALTLIKAGVGQVLGESVVGQDVTQDYTDLQSRLTNLKAAEAELQRIMEEARDTEDVLNVYNQLIYIREQIEVIQGRINYYETSAAFSAISVRIYADEAVQPLTIGGWEPAGVAKDAIQSLINTLKAIAEAVIYIVLYLLPVALVIFIPLRLLWAGVKRLRKPKKAAQAPAEIAEK